jgi:hypothetical protein
MTRFYFFQTVTGVLMWGALSEERTGLYFTIAAGSRQSPAGLMTIFYCLRFGIPNLDGQVSIFLCPRNRVDQVLGASNSLPYLTVQVWDSPNLEGQVRVFISPRNKVDHLYPQVLGASNLLPYCLIWAPPTWIGQGQGYITTNSQSVSMSWCLAQSGTIDQSLFSPWNFF